MNFRHDCQRSVRAGLEFLEKSQLPSGEFLTLVGPGPDLLQDAKHDPSVFTAVNVATSLIDIDDLGARRIVRHAADFLLTEMQPGGLWKFWTKAHPGSRGMPPDVDDTACAASLLGALGYSMPDNRRMLLANLNRQGLFRTWITPSSKHLLFRKGRAFLSASLSSRAARRIFFECGSEIPRKDTFESVVNANVLLYLGDIRETLPVASWLSGVVRKGAASGTDRYYQSDLALFYALTRAVERGCASVRPLMPLISDRVSGIDWRGLSSLYLALCIRVQSSVAPDSANLDEKVSALLSAQLEDGGWPACAFYYDGYGRDLCWGSRELTTGFCIEALERYGKL
ncbi:MAG: hypothetical protein FGM15_08635 [Chthoniobacterales bacterium]|nr:hypothetical protein [Chthoniobacterales bacterium]